MSNSSLVTYTKLTTNCSKPRKYAIDTITIHCIVGQWTAKQGCDYFANPARKASANYIVGKDGSIGLSVNECDRAWTTGGSYKNNGYTGAENDHHAVTIECASDTTHPYAITSQAYSSLIALCTDICRRNGIKKLVWSTNKEDRIYRKNGANLTVHRDYDARSCPGDYIYSRLGDIANAVNVNLGTTPSPQPQPTPTNDFISKVATLVNKYRSKYNIAVASPIIAQAINESGMGTSELAVNAQNYFGLKYRPNRCPTSNGIYKKSATEQMANGTYIVQDNVEWFKFPNLEQCVIGYFDFTNIPNYYNLKGVTDPKTYLENIKSDGYASDKDYVSKCMTIIKTYNLTQYDEPNSPSEPVVVPTDVPYLVRVNTDVLNVRQFPRTTESSVVTTVRKGQIYTIVEENADKTWGRLKSGVGWICLAYTVKYYKE